MSISAKCPNGHVLKVKDGFAGKSGLCPHCRSRVFVPMPVHTTEKARISDDEILGLLGPPGGVKFEPPLPPSDSTSDSTSDSIHDAPQQLGLGLSDSSSLRKQRVCPKCGHLASIAFKHCPCCGTPLPALEAAKP